MEYKVLSAARSFGKVSAEPVKYLESQGFEVVFTDLPKPLSEDDLAGIIKGMDALICGNDYVTKKVFRAADRLKVVSKHGVGVDRIDLEAAAESGIIVTNTPGANTEAVAELAVGLMFALSRQIVQAHCAAKAGGWSRFVGMEILGKNIGIIGLGRIGKAVARRVKGLGAGVLAYDVIRDEEFAAEMGIKYVDLERLLRESDIVTLHTPVTEETENFLDGKRINMMKQGAYLVNTARGELIDEEALAEALGSGQLAGAALDVYRREPPEGSPLLEMNNCITLPHIGAYSREALERMGMMAAENAAAVITNGKPHNIVAGPSGDSNKGKPK